ncbi:unnamed protein product [Lepeophtheirus salmonis]|uniref:(salmon louse) hypothetical protein n=1 Tax=Lepeophtheirus salmonis TaxID=72036 RepID=A0A7R8D6Y9_LEPSM|nr:unnamed protein product [Lepeophtheirus salmonis]CAF3021311.1 unnamed protein product [Lepeophtheirus salmonis]
MKFVVHTFILVIGVVSGNIFEDGMEYIFDTESSAVVGTMDHAPHSSGYSYKYTMRMQVHGDSIKFGISDMIFSQFNGKHEAGRTSLCPKSTIFQRNLVKGLVQKFQLNMDKIKDHGHGFKSEEASIFGDCETLYSVTHDKIIKSVSHTKDCKNRVHVLVDDWNGHRCNIDPDHPESRENPNGLYSASNTVFMYEKKGDRFSPKAIVGSSSVVAQFFGNEGVSFIAHSNSTSFLRKVQSSSGDIVVSGETVTDLKYEFEDKDYTWKSERDLKAREKNLPSGEFFEDKMSNLVEFVKKRLDKVSYIFNDMSTDETYISQAHYYGMNNIYPAMAEMDYDTLKSVSEGVQADKSEEGVRKYNLFNELLGSLGTSASAMLIRDMVMENKFDNYRDAVRVLTAVPFHIRHPSKQLLEEYEKLYDHEGHQLLKDTIPLVIGHLARVTCEHAGVPHSPASKECFTSVVDKYTDKYLQKILSSSDHGKQVQYVSMLFNLRYGNLAEKLKPLIYGETDIKCGHIRSLAFQAAVWGAIYNGKGAEYILPIFADTTNSHELRVTALSYFMEANPSTTHFNTILAVLYKEHDYEVINFAFTLFEKYSLNIDPCKQKVSSLAKYFMKFLKQYSDFETSYGIGVSKTYSRQFYQKKYEYSGSYNYWIVGSHKSTMPLVVAMCIDTSLYGGYSANAMCVHLRIEGLSKAIVRKFKTMSNDVWKVDELQKILMSDMDIKARPDQPIRVEFMLSFKGALVAFRQYDENSIKEGGALKKLFEDMKSTGDSYSINHQRAMRIGSLLYQQPLEIGVPVTYINSFTGVFDIQASVKRGNSRGLMYRDVKYKMNVFAQGSRMMMIQNPYHKNSYGIIQDRIYGSHFPRNFVIGVNPLKKEFKLSVERPSYKNPLMMMMHAQTTILTRSQYVDDNQDISKYCENCKTQTTLSYSPTSVKNRVFMDRECDVTGSYLHGEYFDCEMPSSRGRVLYYLWRSMMPYNKSPKTFGNGIRMGIRQVRAYFTFFPRAEKCGAMLRWSQSKSKPVKEIEITMRATAGPNEPQDRVYKIIIGHEFTPGYLKNTFKLKFQRKGVSGIMSDYSMCMNYQNEYPDFSDEFMDYEKDAIMKLTGQAKVQYGPNEDCNSSPGEIKVSFEHLTTEEARNDMKNTWYYKKCMEQKNLPSWQGRGDRFPQTEACYLTVWDATTARKYSYKVDFVKMTDRMNAIVSQFQSIMKTGLLPYWDIDPEIIPSSNAEPHMNFDVTFKENDKMVDVYMETSQGGHHYDEIPLNFNWYPIMRNLKFTSTLKRLMKYKLIDACTVTTDSVMTLDNVTYPYTPTSCWTLASGHCSTHPNFAVFTKKSSGSHIDTKIYVGGHYIEFQSSGPKKINVMVDGEAVIVGEKEYVHEKDGTQIFKILKWGSTYNVYSFLKVWVTYDGHYMNVIPAPSVTGQHCGLCGNYNKK